MIKTENSIWNNSKVKLELTKGKSQVKPVTQVKHIRVWQPINTMTSQQETGSDTESDTESDSYKIKKKHQGKKI